MTVDWVAIQEFISAITPFISAIGAIAAVAVSMRNSRKINNVHIELNDRLSQLLERTRGEAFLNGRQHERDENGHSK